MIQLTKNQLTLVTGDRVNTPNNRYPTAPKISATRSLLNHQFDDLQKLKPQRAGMKHRPYELTLLIGIQIKIAVDILSTIEQPFYRT